MIIIYFLGMLCAMLVVLMIGGIMIPIFGVSKWTVVAYGSAGALVRDHKKIQIKKNNFFWFTKTLFVYFLDFLFVHCLRHSTHDGYVFF